MGKLMHRSVHASTVPRVVFKKTPMKLHIDRLNHVKSKMMMFSFHASISYILPIDFGAPHSWINFMIHETTLTSPGRRDVVAILPVVHPNGACGPWK